MVIPNGYFGCFFILQLYGKSEPGEQEFISVYVKEGIPVHGEARMWSNPEWYKFLLDHFHTSTQFGVQGTIPGKRLLPVSPYGGLSGRKLGFVGFFST
jgi:hypothetical protein